MSTALQRKLKRGVQRSGAVTVNKVSIAVIKSGRSLPLLRPGSLLAVGVAGRKSGKYRLTPMGCVKVADDRFLVVPEHGHRSDWVRNVKAAGGPVDVWMAGRIYAGAMRESPGESPQKVLSQMKSKLLALMNRALSLDSCVLQITLTEPKGKAAG